MLHTPPPLIKKIILLIGALSLTLCLADESTSQGDLPNTDTKESSKTKKSTQPEESVRLERSTVTASGYEQDIKNAPASIAIIPKEEIMTRPIRDIGDAVQDVPGVYVEATKVGGNEIKMRGLGTSYTLILIDGKRQNVARGFDANGWAGTFSSFMPPASMIERIEVIRGPASTMYGSDAMGGVINIITKKHTNELSAGVQVDSKLAEHHETFGHIYGTNGYVNVPLIKDILSLNVRGGYKYGEQNSFYKPAGLQGQSGAALNNPYASWSSTGFTNWNAGLRLNYTPEAHNYIYLDSEVYFARTGSLNTSGNSITAIRDFYKINNVLSHTADYDWGKLESYVQYSQTLWGGHANVPIGGTKGDKVNWGNEGNGRDNKDAIFQSTYNNIFDFDKFGNLIFSGGVYYMWEQLKVYNTNPASRSNRAMNQVALFAEGEYVINDYISTTLGFRYNYSDIFSAIPNPRLYINVNPTTWLTFKAGVTSGVLVPQLSYLYEGYTESTSGASTIYTYGNQNLQPEKSWNYEFSVVLDTEYVLGIATGYYTDFRDQIASYSVTGTPCPVSQCNYYQNVSKSLLAGAELGVKLKPVGGFSLDVNYGLTYSEVLESTTAANAYLVGGPVNNIPRHNFTITPRYAYGDFNMYVRWSGKYLTPTSNVSSPTTTDARNTIGRYYKDYQILDLALSYKIYKGLSATFAINNLFDTNFYSPILYTSSAGVANGGYTNQYQRILPSRNYWITLKYDF